MGFYLGLLQQWSGIVLSVLVFTVILTKVQHPAPDITFASNCIITTRDGVPHLLIRLGNRRCNLIYHPEAIVSVRTFLLSSYIWFSGLVLFLILGSSSFSPGWIFCCEESIIHERKRRNGCVEGR